MKDSFKEFKEDNQKLWAFTKQFLIIFFYIALTISLQLLFVKALKSPQLIVVNFTYILIDLIILTIFLFLFRKIIIPDFEDFKKNGNEYLKNNFKFYILGLLVMLLSNFIISLFISMPANEEANREVLKLLPIYASINLVFIAPIIEELMTRVILKDVFDKKIYYILFSGFIFGFLHVVFALPTNFLELLYIIPYGTLGCVFAKIYADTNNVWTNIFFHSIHNLICIITIFIGVLL